MRISEPSALLFAQGVIVLRTQFSESLLTQLVDDHQTAITELSLYLGLQLDVGSWTIPTWFATTTLLTMALAFSLLAITRIRARIA
ncbi:MAG: hypothetical protein Q4A82_07215 [Corynebacterium sp.]|nr:hypothetical protein [Corynebacterium sp.]